MTGLSRLLLMILLPAVIAVTGACSGESAPDKAAQKKMAQKKTAISKPDASKAAPAKEPGSAKKTESGNDAVFSEVAIYVEAEPGVKPYRTRYITNEQFLRIDDGHSGGGYILFDRKKKEIYSVVPENQAITVIRNRVWQDKLPKQYKVDIKRFIDKKAPKIQGSRVVNLSITVNKKLCVVYQLAPGLLKKTVEAERAYRAVLASGHFYNIDKTPKEMRDDCFAVTEIFQHSDHLKTGALIRRATWQKKQKMLVDFKTKQPVQRKLFTLPAGYKRYGTGG